MPRWMRSRGGSSDGSKGHEPSVAPQVERVPRLSPTRQPETARRPPTDQSSRGRGAIAQRPMRSPRENDQPCRLCCAPEVPTVCRADGVRRRAQRPGVGRTECEEIHDFYATEPPAAREADTAADGRIILARIGRRGGQHHERDDRTRFIPPAPEAIAVASVSTERRPARHGRRKRITHGPRNATTGSRIVTVRAEAASATGMFTLTKPGSPRPVMLYPRWIPSTQTGPGRSTRRPSCQSAEPSCPSLPGCLASPC